jgi:mono/diheme cytochrome c family protein
MATLIKVGLFGIAGFFSVQLLSQPAIVFSSDDTSKEQQIVRVKQLFKEKCSRCHGEDGRGQTAVGATINVPDFTDKKWWKDDVQDERLLESVRNGKGFMPKFKKKLTEQQIAELVDHVRGFSRSENTR